MADIMIDNWTLQRAAISINDTYEKISSPNEEYVKLIEALVLWDHVYFIDNEYSQYWKKFLYRFGYEKYLSPFAIPKEENISVHSLGDIENSIISEKKKNTGRKNSFTEEQLAHILALQNRGEKITDIARQYHVSRQTIYSQIKRAYNFSDDPDVKMRMNFMNHDDLCTTIDIDFRHEKIKIKNYTDQIIFRAFGVVTEPDWADFEYFLEERCFPRTRDHRKDILREMGLPFYDPLLIIEKTQGRMSDDHQWIMILKKEG